MLELKTENKIMKMYREQGIKRKRRERTYQLQLNEK
jgi:hypothetical protein